MRRPAAAVLALGALVLAGCSAPSTGHPAGEPTVTFPHTAAPHTGDGVIDTTIATDELSSVAGADRWIRGLAVDPGGVAVVLLEPHSQHDGLALARVGATGGWRNRRIDLPGHVLGFGLGIGSDGTIVATEENDDGRLAVTRVDPGGTHTVTAPGSFPLGLSETWTALSADGRTVFVSAHDDGRHTSQLIAVDTTTGAVTGTADLDGSRYIRALAVAPDGGLVLALDSLDWTTATATVVRLDPALHLLSTVPVAATSGRSAVDGLAVGPDGTAWLTVLDGEPQTAAATLRLEALHPGNPAPAVVAQWAAPGYGISPVNVNDLAVDPRDGTVFLLGAPGTDEENETSLTPVSPSGAIGKAVEVDSTGYGSALAFSRDGAEAFVAGNHNGNTDRGAGPVVWTVG